MHRWFSKRDKRRGRSRLKLHGKFANAAALPPEYATLFSLDKSNYVDKSIEKDEDAKIKTIKQRLEDAGIPHLGSRQIRYALRSQYADHDPERALSLLAILDDSIYGVLRDYMPARKLQGAENRLGVTCYLDSLLFAMFARFDCFEAMLYKEFEDEARRNLAVLLRVWVNMLRSGDLIKIDFTKQVLDSLAKCGWKDAALNQQQDVSEAFSFITEKLDLPMLTLKMDIYHTGKEDTSDDHKFVNERLLELAIPPDREDGQPILLEECLEMYFNSRIEVRRYMERQLTKMSIMSTDSLAKGHSAHIETVDLGSAPLSASSTQFPPLLPNVEHVESPTEIPQVSSPATISPLRNRATSIVRERYIPDVAANINKGSDMSITTGRDRKGSIRREVMMPAWQVFSLLPWYTDNKPTRDPQTATHFSSKRPILGMCLKRYAVDSQGKATRRDSYVDIPVEIGLPYFINDDSMEEGGPLYGNFKLSLQAAICHRGTTVNSGHYISLVRGTPKENTRPSTSGSSASSEKGSSSSSDGDELWMRFDDLAEERITLVDIEEYLKKESPYLLFYQILPINEDSVDDLGGEDLPSPQKPTSSPSSPSYERSPENFPGPSFEVSVSEVSPLDEDNGRDSTHPGSRGPKRPPLATVTNADPPGSTLSASNSKENGGISRSNSKRSSIFGNSRSRSRPTSQSGENGLTAAVSRIVDTTRKSTESIRSLTDLENGKKKADENKRSSLDILRGKEKGPGKQRQPSTRKKEPKTPDRECAVM